MLISFDDRVDAFFTDRYIHKREDKEILVSGSHGEITGDFERDGIEVKLFSGDHQDLSCYPRWLEAQAAIVK